MLLRIVRMIGSTKKMAMASATAMYFSVVTKEIIETVMMAPRMAWKKLCFQLMSVRFPRQSTMGSMQSACTPKRAAVIWADGTVVMASLEKMSMMGDSSTETNIRISPIITSDGVLLVPGGALLLMTEFSDFGVGERDQPLTGRAV